MGMSMPDDPRFDALLNEMNPGEPYLRTELRSLLDDTVEEQQLHHWLTEAVEAGPLTRKVHTQPSSRRIVTWRYPRTEMRGKRTYEELIKQFKNQQWSAFFSDPPLGYRHTDDDWLEPRPSEVPLVETIFEAVADASMPSPYQEASDRTAAVHSELPVTPVDPKRIKAIVGKSVYIGEPTATVQTAHDDEPVDITVTDPALQLVSEDVFAAAEETAAASRERSSVNEDVWTIDQLVATFDPDRVVDTIGVCTRDSNGDIQKVCQTCGTEYVRNGTSNLNGSDFDAMMLFCNTCTQNRKTPRQQEYDTLVNTGDL